MSKILVAVSGLVKYISFDGTTFTLQQSFYSTFINIGAAGPIQCTDDGSIVVITQVDKAATFIFNGTLFQEGYKQFSEIPSSTSMAYHLITVSGDGNYLFIDSLTDSNGWLYYRSNGAFYYIYFDFISYPGSSTRFVQLSQKGDVLMVTNNGNTLRMYYKCLVKNCQYCSQSPDSCTACDVGFTLDSVSRTCSCPSNQVLDMSGEACLVCNISNC